MDLVDALTSEGFEVVVGKDAVLHAIDVAASGPGPRLCSGYGVFPGGEKCAGCSDCRREEGPGEEDGPWAEGWSTRAGERPLTPLNPVQKRALGKLSNEWRTAASIKESMMTLDALAKRNLAEYKFLKYEVVWRRK